LIKRIIAITRPAYVSLEREQLVLSHDGEELGRVPCEDIGVLILENAQITVTHRALARCVELNAVVLVCDQRHMPLALLQPLHANNLHTKVLREQVAVSDATHRRIWKQIVARKIQHQAVVLERKQGDGRHLFLLSKRVKSGDEGNLEAQAAKVYWKRLFGSGFRRRTDGAGVNSLLNYGYAIMRAVVARAISSAGLHPALGVHHSNQYNAFALADDLIEPLRPIIDSVVFDLNSAERFGAPIELDSETKTALLEVTAHDCLINDRQLPLLVAVQHYVASFRRVLNRCEKAIAFPSI